MYRITAYNPDWKEWRDYEIQEHSDGNLRWFWVRGSNTHTPVTGPVHFVSKKVGYLDGDEVSLKQAEELTGLYYPAAMDRLRELVHEGGTS
jgi:hypothetical protein